MLSESDFVTYCKQTQLSSSAIEYIQAVRSEPPSRRVGDAAKGNVCSRIPVQSIGQTIQSESRTCESIFIFQTELFDGGSEIWDQPRPIQLRRDKGSNRTHVSAYTPDFLILRADGPTLVECKPQQALDKLMSRKPEDWSYVEGQPRYCPAHEAAEQIGLRHEIFVADDTAPTYLFNLEFLHALRLRNPETGMRTQLARVQDKLSRIPLSIFELCNSVRDLEPATVYRWLACEDLYGAFKAQLLSQEDVFRVFASASDAASFETETLKVLRGSPELRDENLAAILNATPKEFAHAVRLRDKYVEVLDGQRELTRNEYRYKARFEEVAAANGHTLAVFLPRFADRGDSRSRLTKEQDDIINEKVSACVENGTPKTVSALTGQVNTACGDRGVPKVSGESVRLRFINAKAEKVAEGRLGVRGYHNALRPVSAKHATLRSEIAGLIAHVDSTQFDDRVWARSPLSLYLACPWIYVIYDEACSREQGCWIGFGKSDRFALACAIRDTARQQGCLPPYLFSDRGPEYGSIWYETLLAEKNIAKYSRPPGAPRFGGLQESCLKQINSQLAHEMAGNTWADQKGRAGSGSKKSRATARLAFELVGHTVRHFLSVEWNGSRHGAADASPNDLWAQGRAQFGDVGRPVQHDDLAFLIATSVPVDASLGERKGIRVAFREYWNDELNAIRKPFQLEEARLDPETPSTLYVKVKNKWFVTEAHDHRAVKLLTLEGRFLENYRVRNNAAAARSDGRSSKERIARRMEELEISNAAISQTPAPQIAEEPPAPPAPPMVDLNKYVDVPFVSSTY